MLRVGRARSSAFCKIQKCEGLHQRTAVVRAPGATKHCWSSCSRGECSERGSMLKVAAGTAVLHHKHGDR